MTSQLLSSEALPGIPLMRRAPARESDRPDCVGRLIQITLAVYLTPVLLVVAVISGVGMMILGVSETIYGLNEQTGG